MSVGDKSKDAERVRELLAEGTAEAIRISQRAGEVAEDLGFDPELLEGSGDSLYELLRLQLLTANQIIRQSYRLADAAFKKGAPRRRTKIRTIAIEGVIGERVEERLRVRNSTGREGRLAFTFSVHGLDGEALVVPAEIEPGRKKLAPGRETIAILSITLDPRVFEADRVYAGKLGVTLGGKPVLSGDVEIRPRSKESRSKIEELEAEVRRLSAELEALKKGSAD
jgi:hypothetical protein